MVRPFVRGNYVKRWKTLLFEMRYEGASLYAVAGEDRQNITFYTERDGRLTTVRKAVVLPLFKAKLIEYDDNAVYTTRFSVRLTKAGEDAAQRIYAEVFNTKLGEHIAEFADHMTNSFVTLKARIEETTAILAEALNDYLPDSEEIEELAEEVGVNA